MIRFVAFCLFLDAINGNSQDIEILTFNTGLYSGIGENVDNRCAEQILLLKETLLEDAVVCLQGVMFIENLIQIMEQFSHILPYSVSFTHKNNEQTTLGNVHRTPPCNSDDADVLESIGACYGIVRCSLLYQKASNDLIRCAIKYPECVDVLRRLSQDCLTCVYLHVSKDSPVFCQSEQAAMNNPGLVLLSSSNMSEIESGYLYNKSEVRFRPSAYIKANVSIINR